MATISIFLPSFLMTVVAGSSLTRFHHQQGRAIVFERSYARCGWPRWSPPALVSDAPGIHSCVGMLIAVIAGVVLIRYRPNAIWVILGAGLVRFVLGFFIA